MISVIAEHAAQVRVRRRSAVPECDVIVAFRGQEMSLRCRDYNQAVKWARIECKCYKIAGGFTVERGSDEDFPSPTAQNPACAANTPGPPRPLCSRA